MARLTRRLLMPGEQALEDCGLAAWQPVVESSAATFPDGGSYRIEIPSVEGPFALRAVIAAGVEHSVPIHRVSQGSGIMMLTDNEIKEMVSISTAEAIELVLFIGPRASWSIGAHDADSGGLGWRARGRDQLVQSASEALRAVELGVRSLLVADEGTLWMLHCLRIRGDLPSDLLLKMSALSAPGNPASFGVIERLGADTINVPSNLGIDHIAEMRALGTAVIDIYVEAPDGLGGFVRYYDIAELVRVAAPVHLKFGLKNAPDLYPSGAHLQHVVEATGRERVRRAKLGLDFLSRLGSTELPSPLGARACPVPPRFSPSS